MRKTPTRPIKDAAGAAIRSRLASPVTLNPQQAYDLYRACDPPLLIADFHTKLLADGHFISRTLLYKWAKRHMWSVATDRANLARETVKAREAARLLNAQAELLCAQVVRGVSVELVLKLREKINDVDVKTPDDYNALLKALETLMAMEHKLKGDEIGSARAASNGNGIGSGSLIPIDRLKRAVVQIGAHAHAHGNGQGTNNAG